MNQVLIAILISIALAAPSLPAYPHGEAKPDKRAAKPISTQEKEFGREGDPRKASRTVKVEMSDKMRYTPASLTIK